MHWSSAISRQPDLDDALLDAARILDAQLAGHAPDLLCVFGARHRQLTRAARWLHERYQPRALIGCTASGAVGGGQEVEFRPALSLTAAVLPGVELTPFAWDTEALPDLDAAPAAWHRWTGVAPAERQVFVLLAQPTRIDPSDLLLGLDFAYPSSLKVGGLASAHPHNQLLLGAGEPSGSVVGVALSGALRVDAVVAQGCRPLGPSFTVTKCVRNLLVELSGPEGPRRPTEVLDEVYEALGPAERARFSETLQVGVAQSELLGPPEFLIRNVLGADHERGILVTGALLRPGQTLQFHLRDGAAAAEDLRRQLRRVEFARPPAGALLFTCSGRGQALFGAPNHDSSAFLSEVGDVPLGGFFCAGEIGPVGQETHLHGYTSAFAVFSPA